MPGPTTAILNEDIKELKIEVHEIRDTLVVIRGEIRAGDDQLRADLTRLSESFSELKGEIRTALGFAKWAGVTLVTSMLTLGVSSVVAGVWWGSGLTGEVRSLVARFDRHEAVRLIPTSHQTPNGVVTSPEEIPSNVPKPDRRP